MEKNLIFNRFFLRNYGLFAAVVSLAFFSLFYFNYHLQLTQALIDSFISVLSLCTMLLSFYYVVRFARTETLGSFTSVRNSAIAGLLLVTVWLFVTRYFLIYLFSDDASYIHFLHNAQVLRFFAGLFITGLVYLSFFLVIYHKMVKEAIQRESELKLLVQKTELQALKNQLNPHFIYNSLNSISSLTIYSPEKAREMTSLLSDFLRIALRQDAMLMADLEQELKNIELYLQIEKVRFEEKLNWQFQVDEDHLSCKVPAMILQPLLENAVKHGIQQSSQPGTILLSTRQEHPWLLISITNTFDPDFHRYRGEGVGLDNIRNRLRLIYGKASLLKVEIEENTFMVNLEIPL
jgi:two-component system, LytTR family, sensor kinase